MLIIITGSSRGIGYEMVKEFTKDPQNMVIAVSRNIAPLQKLVKERNTHGLLPFKADITNPAHLKKLVATVRSLKLPVQALINNAGEILNKKFEAIRPAELEKVYATNVYAPFFIIQALLPFMNGSGRKHIVNIGSMGGFQGSSKFPGLSAYTSSKAALAVLTECLAEEFKGKDIAVNCLALGSVQTEMLSRAFPGYLAPLQAHQMAEFVCHFALTGQQFFNGKILPVSTTTP
jgi:NAD(P)-dependent dehydrogenase (short-subunit alcohol dehydrogenase family)